MLVVNSLTTPSLAVTTTFICTFPSDTSEISIFPSYPALFPDGYPGYATLTSGLEVPYLTVPLSVPLTYTLTSLIPDLLIAHPLTFIVEP